MTPRPVSWVYCVFVSLGGVVAAPVMAFVLALIDMRIEIDWRRGGAEFRARGYRMSAEQDFGYRAIPLLSLVASFGGAWAFYDWSSRVGGKCDSGRSCEVLYVGPTVLAVTLVIVLGWWLKGYLRVRRSVERPISFDAYQRLLVDDAARNLDSIPHPRARYAAALEVLDSLSRQIPEARLARIGIRRSLVLAYIHDYISVLIQAAIFTLGIMAAIASGSIVVQLVYVPSILAVAILGVAGSVRAGSGIMLRCAMRYQVVESEAKVRQERDRRMRHLELQLDRAIDRLAAIESLLSRPTITTGWGSKVRSFIASAARRKSS